MIQAKEWAITFGRQQAKAILALSVIILLFLIAQPPVLSKTDKASIAETFAFSRFPLPQILTRESKDERIVNPHLARHSGWISAVGAAIALNDLDGDGLPNDLCQVETRTDQVMIAPVPGSGDRYKAFALDIPRGNDLPGTIAPMGCVPHDMNEDGQMDLLIYFWGRTPIAFIKHSTSELSQDSYLTQTIVSEPSSEQWFTNAATFADIDGDGHNDLIIGNYFADNADILNPNATSKPEMQDSMTRAYNGGMNHIFLWTDASAKDSPSVTFTDVKDIFSSDVSHAWTLAIGAADLDGDLLPEIYFANDFGPDRLLHNRSRAGDIKLAVLAGQKPIGMPNSKVLGNDGFKGMGVDFADLNNDGLLDIYVSNIADEYALEESHFAFVSTGKPEKMKLGIAPYLDKSESLGLSRSSWGWETKFGDFNNDGVSEALQATGFRKGQINRWPELQELAIANDGALRHARSWFAFQAGDDLSGHDPNAFFVRGPNGRFYDLSNELGLADPYVTRGIATADVDGDGDLDFAIANQWEESYFYRNDTPHPGQFLGLRLHSPSGSPVIGAMAKVISPDGQIQVAQVDGGNGHSGVRSSDLHFGLGNVPDKSELPVRLQWRDKSGQIQQTEVLLTPGWHTVELGSSGKILTSIDTSKS